MKVLFTHGYFLEEDHREQVIMKPYPPLGLLYLAAWLDRHGVSNEVYDTTFSSREVLKAYVLEKRPEIMAVYTNLMTKLKVIELVRWIRNEPALADTLVVLGGPDVTHNVPEYLGIGADIIVIGEGEQTMLEIALSANGRNVAEMTHISGLAFQTETGLVFKTTPREKIRDIDQLPFPAREKINLQRYLDAWKKAHGHSAVSMSTQRGCPYTCRWCSTAVYGQSYRRRSPENVVDEIEILQKSYQFDLIWFVDDVFTVSHKWLQAFHGELKKRRVQIKFECITRADRLTEEVLRLLHACGCFRVWIGAESGSQRIINAMDRRVEVGQVQAMIRVARQIGIEAGTFIMLGYPGETEADIEETVAHLKASNPNLFTITVAYPIKGTGLYEEVQTTASAGLPWAESTDRDLEFPRTYPRKYYDFAVRWTVNEVLWYQAKLAGRQFTPAGFKLLAKSLSARAGMALVRKFGGKSN